MQDQTERPNVLLICVDHWGGLMNRPAGHPVVMTPTIAQMARCGTMYTNAYSACPTCIPARRSLMTGLSARTHGDRIFKEFEPMPDAPTLADCFAAAGYQTGAVGKLHVYPQRDRIGFHEVINNEEGRHHLGSGADDWELYLADQGYGGQEYATGVCNNEYHVHPWHLPERLHPTNWAVAQMSRMIHRRDPRKPGFWYLSFVGPHPPMWPPQAYLDLYRDVPMDDPVCGPWARDTAELPHALRVYQDGAHAMVGAPGHEVDQARRGFYASITHIDHQIRLMLGYLREQGLIDNTIIAFTSDHGDMLGDHGLWAKSWMYEMSAKIPLIVMSTTGDDRVAVGVCDDRLAEIGDIMPTLLELAELDVPEGVEGRSLIGEDRREWLYGEHWEGERSTRMMHDGRYKLIYYAVGNVRQLFDIVEDPREQHDLAGEAAHAERVDAMSARLVDHLYGEDRAWAQGGALVGLAEGEQGAPQVSRSFSGQRGCRFM